MSDALELRRRVYHTDCWTEFRNGRDLPAQFTAHMAAGCPAQKPQQAQERAQVVTEASVPPDSWEAALWG